MVSKFTIFNSGVFHSDITEEDEKDPLVSIIAPLSREKPADWDGRNTYNLHNAREPLKYDEKPPVPYEKPADWDHPPIYNPDNLPQDWDGKNKPPEGYVDPIRPLPDDVTPPVSIDYDRPADWDHPPIYNPDNLPQDWDGKNKPPEGYVDPLKPVYSNVLDMDDNSIEHLLQSNFGSREPKSHVASTDASVQSAPTIIGFDDAHLQIKATNGDF